ncbi:hypothetical protein HD598_001363 [Neomicrococcus aestuarii]|uniref:Uncharacterized protein n=1 Tax=Neomicrococcus aestuarii TaxID=556325 RepID=A0A7W8WYT7_9MICC|nr:hypothetical protein [Neomicrococcus aestuarii]MBB5512676.1 hypothetical protein [Neomicrococcus aestuarii]
METLNVAKRMDAADTELLPEEVDGASLAALTEAVASEACAAPLAFGAVDAVSAAADDTAAELAGLK